VRVNVGKIAVSAIKEWNPFSPEAYERRDKNKAYRKARRKAKKGEVLTEDEYEILSTNQETEMFPQNTLRKGGIAVTVLGPLLSMLLKSVGVGDCSAEALETGCVGAAEIAGTLISVAGAAIYWWGQNRAFKRGE
jgi:uncharacterized protein YjeT (DUF2065 family)